MDKYDTPFGVGDGVMPITSGAQVAPPVPLKDLLHWHGCTDLLSQPTTTPAGKHTSTCLTGDELVFVVDTEGLDSAIGQPSQPTETSAGLRVTTEKAASGVHTTGYIPAAALIHQLFVLLSNAASCFYVTRGRPTVQNMYACKQIQQLYKTDLQ